MPATYTDTIVNNLIVNVLDKNTYDGLTPSNDELYLITDDGNDLPVVTSSDNGKVLRVVNGVWAAASLPSASGVSF